MPTDDDPGWGLSWWLLAVLVFPPAVFLFTRGRTDLRSLRKLFLAAAISLIAFLRVTLVLEPDTSARRPAFALVAIGLAVSACGAVVFFPTRLEVDDEKRLAASYSINSFIGLAFAVSGALYGFVAFFLSGERWAYPATLPFAFLGLYLAAPTRARLARIQRQVDAQGSQLSLVRALQTTAP